MHIPGLVIATLGACSWHLPCATSQSTPRPPLPTVNAVFAILGFVWLLAAAISVGVRASSTSNSAEASYLRGVNSWFAFGFVLDVIVITLCALLITIFTAWTSRLMSTLGTQPLPSTGPTVVVYSTGGGGGGVEQQPQVYVVGGGGYGGAQQQQQQQPYYAAQPAVPAPYPLASAARAGPVGYGVPVASYAGPQPQAAPSAVHPGATYADYPAKGEENPGA
jgi:hypothetical protein